MRNSKKPRNYNGPKNLKTPKNAKDYNGSGKITKEDIVYLFAQKTDIPLSLADIKHNLNIESSKMHLSVKTILDLMVESGELILTKGEKYAYARKLNLIQGTVVFKKNGYAFISDDTGGKDIFVRNYDIGDAILGDTVILKIIPDNPYYKKKKKKEGKTSLSAGPKSGRLNDRRGRVVRIIKRSLKNFKAIVKVEKSIAILSPISPEFDDKFIFDMHKFKNRDKLKSGNLVSAVLPETADFSSRIALIENIMGDIESAGTEEDIILNKYALYDSFEAETLKELDEIPENIEEISGISINYGSTDSDNKKLNAEALKDRKDRVDLTDLSFVTIDGEDAKDFDDAIYLRSSPDLSEHKLYVAIADVSYFVKIGSIIDREAFKRGNSTYFPRKVYPMLPERLSNDLCSLLPRKTRFVMVCEMNINGKGKIIGTKVYKAAIKTFGRLTYNEVYNYLSSMEYPAETAIQDKAGLDKNKKKRGKAEAAKKIDENKTLKNSEITSEFEELNAKLFPIRNMLLNMKMLAGILRSKRTKGGGLDFDSLYGKVIMGDKGEVINVIPEPRNFAHNLIEDFMITANCAVSQFIEDKKIPSIYRVHEKPDEDRVKEFLKMLKYFKFSVSYDSLNKPKDYQKMLDGLKHSEVSSFLEQAFLRSMKIAVYSPVNIHHFGLALKSYTHFTSPIRRYADLMVHRILKWMLYNDTGYGSGNSPGNGADGWKNSASVKKDNKKFPPWLDIDNLKAVSTHVSRREKLSADAEREYLEFKKMQFLKQNSERVFDGFITSVLNFGFFVDISGFFIQGFVHVSTIADDYYEYNEYSKILNGRHTKRVFKIGDKVSVSVYSIDLLKREIDLRFIKFI